MLRIWHLLLIASTTALAQPGHTDPAFADISFENWVKHPTPTHLQWTMQVTHLRLSESQHLQAYLRLSVDARRGPLHLFIEVRDRENNKYQRHRILKLKPDADIDFSEAMEFAPGHYQVLAAIYDPASREHSLRRTALNVSAPFLDPLSTVWRDQPKVQFVSHRVPLPVNSKAPVRIEVVAVVDYTHRSSAVVPRLSVLTGMQVDNGSMNVTLVDMENRKVSSAPVVMGKLNRGQLWEPLRTPPPPAVDHREDAQFFVSEVRKRLEQPDTDTPPTLIVLSAPERFGKGEDLEPIHASMLPGGRAFYIRCTQGDNWVAPPLSIPFAEDAVGGGLPLPVSTRTRAAYSRVQRGLARADLEALASAPVECQLSDGIPQGASGNHRRDRTLTNMVGPGGFEPTTNGL